MTDTTDSDSNSDGHNHRKHWLDIAAVVLSACAFIAACFAARFTGWQAWIARDTEARQVRAYVFLKDIKLQRQEGDIFDIIPEWENSGASETKNMRAYMNRYMADFNLPTGLSYGKLPPNASEVPILLGPKSISNTTFGVVDRHCLTQFNRRDALTKFYLWGITTYNDTLTNESHITRFCWDVTKVIFAADGESARLSHALCEEGNCADKECPTPNRQTFTLPNLACKPDLPNVPIAIPESPPIIASPVPSANAYKSPTAKSSPASRKP